MWIAGFTRNGNASLEQEREASVRAPSALANRQPLTANSWADPTRSDR
jgi:hypothetical protein